MAALRIGEIQGVVINTDESSGVSRMVFGDVVWFVKESVRNVSLGKLRDIDYKIGSALVKVGYSIKDVKGFNASLKHLFKVGWKTR